ncbi:MAG: RNA polymerase sigma factor [Steroidobacteraceae bacterium]
MPSAVADAASRDRDIVELLRAGHQDRAFEELLRRYEGKIYRLCCALLHERTLAEDAAQESIVRVWKSLANYDGRAALSSWLYAITRNRCLTALASRRSFESLIEDGLEDTPAQSAASCDDAIETASERLRELVDELPERLRRVLVLYYFEEHSVGEVALMLGCPEGTVKTYLFRARAALARELERRGLNDPGYWMEIAS